MKNGVQRPRTDPIPVTLKFRDHALSVDRLLRGVMKNVQADQSGIEIAVGISQLAVTLIVAYRYRKSIKIMSLQNLHHTDVAPAQRMPTV